MRAKWALLRPTLACVLLALASTVVLAIDHDPSRGVDSAVVLSVLGFAEVPAGTQDPPLTPVPQFYRSWGYGLDGESRGLAVADFNGDLRPDLAVANHQSDTVSIAYGLEVGVPNCPGTDGCFTDPWSLPVGPQPVALDAADFNGDGFADLVVVETRDDLPSGAVLFLPGTGTGGFGAGTRLTVGARPLAIASADLDQDGHRDIVVGNAASLSVLLGDGSGGFTPVALIGLGRMVVSVVVADVEGNGSADIAVSAEQAGAGYVAVLVNDGDAGFQPPAWYATGPGPRDIVAADFGGDGRVDLAVANAADDSLSLLVGEAGGFAPERRFALNQQQPQALAVADVNGDGLLDAIVGDRGPNGHDLGMHLEVLPGDATTWLGAAVSLEADLLDTDAQNVWDIAVADFDGDGKPDLAATDNAPVMFGGVVALLNVSGNVADLSLSIAASGDRARVNHWFPFDLRIVNGGPDRALPVTFTVQKPDGVDAAATGYNCESVSNTLKCSLRMAAHADVTIPLYIRAHALGDVEISVTLRTGVLDPDLSNNAVAAAIPVMDVGGRGLTAGSSGGAATLRWDGGEYQAGYFVGRLAGGVTTVLPAGGVPLPRGATGFVDPAPLSRQVNCYVVAPVDAAGAALGLSEMLCVVPGVASGDLAPRDFTLRLDDDIWARLAWTAPGSQAGYRVDRYALDGTPKGNALLPAEATSHSSYLSGSRSMCFVVIAGAGTTVLGHTDALCAVRGVGTLESGGVDDLRLPETRPVPEP